MGRPLMLMVMYLPLWLTYRSSAMVSMLLRYSFSMPEAGKAIAMILGVM